MKISCSLMFIVIRVMFSVVSNLSIRVDKNVICSVVIVDCWWLVDSFVMCCFGLEVWFSVCRVGMLVIRFNNWVWMVVMVVSVVVEGLVVVSLISIMKIGIRGSVIIIMVIDFKL